MAIKQLSTLAAITALTFAAGAANAQNIKPWLVSEPSIACDGNPHQGSVYSTPPSDIVTLPATIVAAQAWWITGSLSSDALGTVGLALDKGSAYIKATGFPNSQLPRGISASQINRDGTTLYHSIMPLVPIIPVTVHSSQVSPIQTFNPPIVWSPGDSVYTGFGCVSQYGGIQMSWVIYFETP